MRGEDIAVRNRQSATNDQNAVVVECVVIGHHQKIGVAVRSGVASRGGTKQDDAPGLEVRHHGIQEFRRERGRWP